MKHVKLWLNLIKIILIQYVLIVLNLNGFYVINLKHVPMGKIHKQNGLKKMINIQLVINVNKINIKLNKNNINWNKKNINWNQKTI